MSPLRGVGHAVILLSSRVYVRVSNGLLELTEVDFGISLIDEVV